MDARTLTTRDLPAQNEPNAPAWSLRRAGADLCLAGLFRLAPRWSGALRRTAPFLCGGAFRVSRQIRLSTTVNARRILGPDATDAQVDTTARSIVRNFYTFCCDVAAGANDTRAQLLERVEAVEGHDHFLAARERGRGVIVVTAHMGSFEVGLAALREIEPAIHVVFRRDAQGAFEQSRQALRERLGVKEAPVDDGWTVWMRLRDALLQNEAVVLQGDRVMPGQKGQPVPFLGGNLLMPTGPFKLAMATGAPIVPVFSLRTPSGRLRVVIEPAIGSGSKTEQTGAAGIDAALAEWAQVLERYVRAYPDQWLLLQPALVEDDKVMKS